MWQSRGTQVLRGCKDDQKTDITDDVDFIKPLPYHRLQNMHKYPKAIRKTCDKVTLSDINVLLLRRLEMVYSYYNK